MQRGFGNSARVVFTGGWYNSSKDEISRQCFTYLTCAACGAKRLSPCPSADLIHTYYPDNYACHSVRHASFSTRIKRLTYLAFCAPDNQLGWQPPFWRVLLYAVRSHTVFAFHAIEPKRIYEFGASTGNDLMLFKAEGWEVDGSVPSTRVCRVAAERGIALQTVPAEAVELPPASVSAVLMNHVLEHTYEPARVISTSFRGLNPGGSLVVVVPNHAGLSARIFGASWPGYDAPRHIWGFTPASLEKMMYRAALNLSRFTSCHKVAGHGALAWTADIPLLLSLLGVGAGHNRCRLCCIR